MTVAWFDMTTAIYEIINMITFPHWRFKIVLEE